MKKRIYDLIVVCFLMSFIFGCSQIGNGETSVAAEPETPRVTTVEDGKFTICFPGKANESMETLELSEGKTEIHSYFLQLEHTAYNFAYNDYPEGSVKDAFTVLENAITSLPEGVEESKDITLGKYPGKDLKYKVTSGDESITVYQRIYIVGDRMYQIQYMADSDEINPKKDLFFDSFVLTK
ncbi:hypothetical protein [Clostridium sp. E02]|uniref:hypothetical protein n=1 Tax=Clostridium sp. E02 TaxID=2487134 RepID=UPI000F53A813|nr:hypothetical protein [Clostridium sp. E02]